MKKVNQVNKQALSKMTADYKTMGSLEIAEIMNKRHDNVMRDIRVMLDQAEIDPRRFEDSYLSAQNKKMPCYHLPRLECDIVVSGYSVKYRAAIIRRWHELEAEQATPSAPLTADEAVWLNRRGISTVARNVETDAIKLLHDYATESKYKNGFFGNMYAHVTVLEYAGIFTMSGGRTDWKETKQCLTCPQLDRLASLHEETQAIIIRDIKTQQSVSTILDRVEKNALRRGNLVGTTQVDLIDRLDETEKEKAKKLLDRVHGVAPTAPTDVQGNTKNGMPLGIDYLCQLRDAGIIATDPRCYVNEDQKARYEVLS